MSAPIAAADAATSGSASWDPSEWDALAAAATILGAFITLAGVLITGSVWWVSRQKVAEQRLTAYRALWTLLEPAQLGPGAGSFDASEREALATKLTGWYYEWGIFLTDGARSMLLTARDHLYACYELPSSLKDRVGSEGTKGHDSDLGRTPDERRRNLSRDELSLLRTRMKADLGQYGRWSTHSKLDGWKKDFLKECDESPRRRPWRRRLRDVLKSGRSAQ